jgi:hypothetical protein
VQMEADRDIILDWRVDMEPHLLALLEAKHARQGKGSYKPCEAQDVAERLGNLLDARGINARALNVRRMGGGASRNSFCMIRSIQRPARQNNLCCGWIRSKGLSKPAGRVKRSCSG